MKFEPLFIMRDLTGGMNTKQRANKIADNQLQSIKSMDMNANSLRRAPGYTLLGTESDDELLGKTLYAHSILAGQKVLVKSIGTFLKFLDRVDNAWYKLTDDTFTEGLKWSFDKFNGYLYGNNGTDDWIFWQGSTMTTIVGDITAATVTITLPTGKTALYPNSGTIMIQDEPITYTGKAGDTLTGCTVTQNHPSGSTVILRLDSSTYSTVAKADQIAFFRNRMYLIDDATPTIIRHSKLADNTNPETDLLNFAIAGGTAGDAGFGIAPDQIIAIKSLINGNNSSVLAAFCKDGNVYAFVVSDGTATTTNSFVPMRTMTTYPTNKRMVTVVENDLMMADQFGHIRTLGYGDVNTPLQVQTISQLIEPSLEAMNFDDGAMIYHKRKKYIIGKTPDGEVNDLTFYHDSNYSAWGSYGHWDCIDLAEYDGMLCGLSSITGNVWRLNNGYEANEQSYYSEAVIKELEFGAPLVYKETLKLRMSGLITTNCLTYLDIFTDNNEQPITFKINGDNVNIIGPNPNVAVGTVVFGSGVFGGGLPNGVNRREFFAQLQFNTLTPFLKLSARIRMDGQNIDFEMNDLLFWVKVKNENQWLSAKVLTPS